MILSVKEENYANGLFDGEYAGEHDREQGLGITHDVIATAREDARTTESRSWRTYRLGWLRGYRSAVRTFERGSWGT